MLRLATVTAVLVALGSTAGAQSQSPNSVTPLFDGKTLSGWSVDPKYANHFSVRNGVLHLEGAGK